MSIPLIDKRVGYSILSYLLKIKEENLTNDEGLDLSIQCLCNVFGIDDINSEKNKSLGLRHTLRELVGKEIENETDPVENEEQFKKFLKIVEDKGYFKDVLIGSDEYKKKYKTLIDKYKLDKMKTSSNPTNAKDNEVKANQYKEDGNKYLNSGDFNKAYEFYSKCIELCPNNKQSHIYYSNRAAALMYLEKYSDAIGDCKKSIELDPTFIKAYKRLSNSYVKLNKYNEAIDILEKAKRISPDDKEILSSIEDIKTLQSPKFPSPPSGNNTSTGEGGMPGIDGLQGLFNNPNIMSAATKMMGDPNFMNMVGSMMGNPAMQQAMNGMGFGGNTNTNTNTTTNTPNNTNDTNNNTNNTNNSTGFDMSLITELMKPENLEKLKNHPKIMELLNDSEVGPMISATLTSPLNAMQYLSNPAFQSKIPIIIGAVREIVGK